MEKVDIILIDDDPMAGELTRDILADEGWNVVLIDDSTKAIDEIKKLKPGLVITDIMMPGINGMEICKRIKSTPEIKSIKVIILSGKSYEKEKERAMMLGADYFISKPYDVKTFSKLIRSILEGTSAPPPPPSMAKQIEASSTIKILNQELNEKELKITAWGIRGLSYKLPTTNSEFGRQSICLSVETNEDILIFDAGSGIYDLGEEIINKGVYKNIWLFLTHYHLDNVIGLPHFKPFLHPQYTINIVGPNDPEKSLKEIIRTNLYSSFSPIESTPKAKINLYEVMEENYVISNDIKMATMYSNHPTTTMIYLFNIKGSFKLAYAPDSEIWEESTAFQDYNERLGKFTSKFDILIHDAYYDEKEYKDKNHKGHSSIKILCEFALKNQIKTIIPVNINPQYSDERIIEMIKSQEKTLEKSQTKLILLKEKESKIFDIT